MSDHEQRWSILYHGDHVSIEPVENGCRQYECCGGSECGFTVVEAQENVVHHYQRHADHWREMTPAEFLAAQGYTPSPVSEEA